MLLLQLLRHTNKFCRVVRKKEAPLLLELPVIMEVSWIAAVEYAANNDNNT